MRRIIRWGKYEWILVEALTTPHKYAIKFGELMDMPDHIYRAWQIWNRKDSPVADLDFPEFLTKLFGEPTK
jgi:hypothetical protein